MAVDTAPKSPLGVLILHGFTSTGESVEALGRPLEALGIPFSIPLLRGHGEPSPEALRGVRWRQWLDDAEAAFEELSLKARRLVVVGHSMGALLGLNLAAVFPGRVDSLVLVTPAFRLVSLLGPGRPMHFAAGMLSAVFRKWNLKSVFADPDSASCKAHYEWAPTDAILSFFELVDHTALLLPKVGCPVFIVHNRHEQTVLPESVALLSEGIATPQADREILWLERSGHQVFCDCERELAVGAVVRYVSGRLALCQEPSIVNDVTDL
ncbi:alpha/beta hydrolase [Chlorobium phaeovibrioides]|uniref:Alpha/beta fold hydrolase n=1 Tax=Chlorobium phaeovibrioides TaxID=1094 RepID=A0ABW9UMF3_CHLPH|nr:alpha/beta fold hydrolase [Chlorobium phaeovibrioides]MWV54253.1 alpha/beta fold hydrolase [Chlorobium phaeovibrioides]